MKLKNIIKTISHFGLFLGLLFSLWSVSPALSEETQKINANEIRENAKQFLLDELTWGPDRMAVHIVYRGTDLVLPEGELNWNFNLPGRKNRIGQVPFQLTLKQNGRVLRQMRLKAQVEVTYELFKTTQSFKRGHILESNDVEMTQIQSSKMIRNMVTDWDQLVGYELTRSIEAGQSLSNYMVKKVPMVKRGDRIMLIAIRGSLRVTAPGVVRENGFKDQMVKVENIESHKVVYGTVQDSRTIIVNF